MPLWAVALGTLALVSACGGDGDGGTTSPPPGPPPPANRAPSLTTTALSTDEDVTVSLQLVATDPDNQPLTFTLSTNPQHGSATVSAAGGLSYTPADNFSGSDAIGITVNDGSGGQTTGTLNITVNAVNDAPALTTTQLAVDEDGVLNAQLTGTDIEASAFTFELVPDPMHGTATVSPSGELTYAPEADYSGADQIRVRLRESASFASADQIVNIEVRARNDAPVAQDDIVRVTASRGQQVALPILANDIDVDGDPLAIEVVAQPVGGAVAMDPATGQIRFTPANEFLGPIEFTYRVNDGTTVSNTAHVSAVIGDFESVIFLSDYTTPGLAEVHVYDGLEVLRVSDQLPAGQNITGFSVSGDLRTLLYVTDASDAERVYAKPLDGTSPAVLRYTSSAKTSASPRVGAYLNGDGSHAIVMDGWSGATKTIFMLNIATGSATRVAGLMPGLLEVRYPVFHPFEPRLFMIQGQTAGAVPRTSDSANTAFLGDAADAGTLTQIGRTYTSGDYGSGEGFYYGPDPRYIYHAEFLRIGSNFVTNLLAYDRQTGAESVVVRSAVPPDRGMNGTGWLSPDLSRLCFAYYLPSTTTHDGPGRFFAMQAANPGSAMPVSPVHSDTSQCTFASDNRTMIYRIFAPGRITQHAYAIDSVTPGSPRSLAPSAEASSEQGAWHAASHAMRVNIGFFDNDGTPGSGAMEVGRMYSISLDGAGDPFLFSSTYRRPTVTSTFYDSNDQGSFMIYARPQGAISALELMNTRLLDHSIPLSRPGETVGVKRAAWLRRYPEN